MDSVQREEVVVPPVTPMSERSLGRRFLKNSAVLAVGWNINAVGRLVAAGLVVRTLGVNVFGEYALLVVWLTIAEWILDFGSTEVFVREANQEPEQRSRMVRVFLALKGIQAPVAVLVLVTGLIAMQYSHEIVRAGFLASLSLFFTAGVVFCRANFKAALTMEREVLSEFVSVLVMLPLIVAVAHFGWGVMGLMATYVVSRAVFCTGCVWQSRDQVNFSIRGVNLRDIGWGIHSIFAIGIIGFVVVLYSAVDLLVLSRTTSIAGVAVYSAALRFTMPLTMALNAIAVSVYPVLSLLKSPEQFHKTCQRAVDITVLLGCLALVCLWCGAEFFMSLLGRGVVYGADALRILAVVCVIKAVPMVIGPALFLVRAQRYALAYMLMALSVKIAVIAGMALKFGYMGAAFGSLFVETFFLTPVTMFFVQRFTGYTMKFPTILRLIPIVVVIILITRKLLPQGNILGAVVAGLLYPLLVVGLRVVNPTEILTFLRAHRSEESSA